MLRHYVISQFFLPGVNHSLYASASRNLAEVLPQGGDVPPDRLQPGFSSFALYSTERGSRGPLLLKLPLFQFP